MRKALMGLVVADMMASVFVSPIGGLETRNPFEARPLGFALLGVFGLGMALVVASLVNLARNNPKGPLQGAIGAALFLPTVVADQAGLFHPVHPPSAISEAEYVVIVLSAMAVGLGAWLRSRPSTSA